MIGIVTRSVVTVVLLLGVGTIFFLHRNAKKGEKSSSEQGELFGNLTELPDQFPLTMVSFRSA
jgi:hypothetical protein